MRPEFYKYLPAIQKHIATFCCIDNGKIIFSGETILRGLQNEAHAGDHVNRVLNVVPAIYNAFKISRLPNDKLQILLPAMTRNKASMSLARILIYLEKDQEFLSAIELGIFLFYNGKGEFNELMWNMIKSKTTTTGGINLADFITCIIMKTRSEAPKRAGFFKFQQFEMNIDNIKIWRCVFEMLTDQKSTYGNISIHIDTLKLFFTDPLACFDFKNQLAPKRKVEVEKACCGC